MNPPDNGDAGSSTAVIHRDTEADPDAPRIVRPTQATHEIGTQANEEPSWPQRDLSTALDDISGGMVPKHAHSLREPSLPTMTRGHATERLRTA